MKLIRTAYRLFVLLLLTQGCGSDPVMGSDAADFEGVWEQENPDVGYESYLLIDGGGRGFQCCADGKSAMHFEYDLSDDGILVMGAYGYGGGDGLQLLDGGQRLERTGEDHGEAYVESYTKVLSYPGWCDEQISEMKAFFGLP